MNAPGQMPGLRGKRALVTGASRGIGKAVALELARQGCCLLLTARDEKALEAVAGEARQCAVLAEIVAGDLAADGFAGIVADRALAELGGVDLLVNCAGATRRAPFIDFTDRDWRDGFALKFFGAVRLCRALWPSLSKRHGAIVNIAGAGGRTPDKVFTIGSSVNAALMAFTKALADLGIADGVRVNLVNPGHVRTDRYEKRTADAMRSTGLDRESVIRRGIEEARIIHVAEPGELARVVAFLLSDDGRPFHGSLIDVDAGITKGI